MQVPPAAPPSRTGPPRWVWWAIGIFGVLVILAVTADAASESPPDEAADDGGAECNVPNQEWLELLSGSFFPEYRDATIEDAAYVEVETSEGPATYVALKVDAVDRVAVFGSSGDPSTDDPGLTAAANGPAFQLSNLDRRVARPDSPEDALLRDPVGRSLAQRCLEPITTVSPGDDEIVWQPSDFGGSAEEVEKRLVLTNTGEEPLFVDLASTHGTRDALAFTAGPGTCAEGPVQAGGTCEVVIVYRPVAGADRQTATLKIVVNTAQGFIEVPLTAVAEAT